MPCARNQRATARAPSSSKGRTSAPVKSSRPPTPLTRCARHDPVGLDPEVGVAVAVGHRLAGDLEHRLVALGGDVAQRVDLALEQLVGGHRGAVADRADRVAVALRQPEQAEHLVDAGHEPVGRVARRRRRLGGDQLAGVLVEGDDVGEGATGVDADADPAGHGASLPPVARTRRRRNLPTETADVGECHQRAPTLGSWTSRSWCAAPTRPAARSRRTATCTSASRSAATPWAWCRRTRAAPEWPLDGRVVDGDFRGPAVHGKKGDRFLYVTWVDQVGGHFHGFRRGKLMLDRIDPAVVASGGRGWPHAGRHGVADRREGRTAVREVRPAGDRLDGRVSQLSFARSL